MSNLVGNTEDRFSCNAANMSFDVRNGLGVSLQAPRTSSPKGNHAHLRAIIQSEKKWKHQFFRRLRAASSVVRGWIWPNFKLIQAIVYVIITCKYEKDPIKNNREKMATPFSKL